MNYCTSRVDFFGLTDDGACSNGADDHCDYLMALVSVETETSPVASSVSLALTLAKHA